LVVDGGNKRRKKTSIGNVERENSEKLQYTNFPHGEGGEKFNEKQEKKIRGKRKRYKRDFKGQAIQGRDIKLLGGGRKEDLTEEREKGIINEKKRDFQMRGGA